MNTKQLSRIFARSMYAMVILVLVFSTTGSVYAQDETVPHIEAFAWLDRYSLADWPAGIPVDVTIENPSYPTETFTPDGSSNWYEFFPAVDIQPGSTITATNGITTKVLTVSTLSATVDPATGIVNGTATPEWAFHMRTDADHFANPIEEDIVSDSAGTWSADFSTFAPLTWFTRGEMWEGDDDGDVTYAIWHVHQEVIEVFLAQNEIRAFDWPRDVELTFYMNNEEIGKAITEPVFWMEGTWAVLNASDHGLQLEPGMEIMVSDGTTWKSTIIQDMRIAYANPGNDTVYGYAPANANLELRSTEDSPVFRFFNADSDGNWAVDYREPSVNGVTVDLNPGDTLTLFMRDAEKDSTVWETSVPNPFIAVSLTQNWFWVNNFTPETLVTFYIYENQGDEIPIFEFTRTTDASGNVSIEGWEHTWDPEPDNYMVATDGINTKELLLEYLTLDVFDFDNDVISGMAATPGRKVDVGVGNADGEQWLTVYADDGGRWTAEFKPISFDVTEDMWAGGHVNDDDGDVTAAHNSGPSGPPEFLLYDIYIFNPETMSIERLTELELAGEFNPSWSPNGKLVAHDVVRWNSPQSIYITDVKTGLSTPLAGAEDGGNDAVWSPNGKWIVFDRVPAGDLSLYIVPSIGGTPTLLKNDAVSADWAPNGKCLVFQDATDGMVKTIDVNGDINTMTVVAPFGMNPSWSPDGNWIAYEDNGDIWKVQVNVQGNVFGDPIQVTGGPFNDGQPTWSADSTTIVYHSGFNTDWDLWSVPASGGMGTWLNGAPDVGDYDPAYAKNSANVAYASISPDGQAARTWVAAYTYDAGTWETGTHTYQFWAEGAPAGEERSLNVSIDNPFYPGLVLIRPGTLRAETSDGCANIEVIHPDQQTRFHVGWTFDGVYTDARIYLENLNAQVRWDTTEPANMLMHEIFPLTGSVDWFGYTCTFTAP